MKKQAVLSLITLTFTVLLSSTFISCKKTVTGPVGATGAAGVQGEAGANGNANVKSLSFITGNNWRVDSTAKNYNYTYHTASITGGVMDNGFVMVYMSDDLGNNGTEWKSIPYSTKDLHFSFKYALSQVQVFLTSSTGTMPAFPASQRFKVVIVPPGN